jgi:hypothetical protein
MKRKLLLLGLVFSMIFVTTAATGAKAQNYSANDSTTAGNMSISLNQNVSQMGPNISTTMNNASEQVNQTVSDIISNASSPVNKTRESLNATITELGKNASALGEVVVNKTGEVGQKIESGAASVLSNITGEITSGMEGK